MHLDIPRRPPSLPLPIIPLIHTIQPTLYHQLAHYPASIYPRSTHFYNARRDTARRIYTSSFCIGRMPVPLAGAWPAWVQDRPSRASSEYLALFRHHATRAEIWGYQEVDLASCR